MGILLEWDSFFVLFFLYLLKTTVGVWIIAIENAFWLGGVVKRNDYILLVFLLGLLLAHMELFRLALF